MSSEIKIPPFGESITSALIAQWHKKSGDPVKKGDTLVTLETDKVSNDLEAEEDGILEITVPEGEEVSIGTVCGMIRPGHDQSAPAQPQESSSPPHPQSAEPQPQQPASSNQHLEITVPPFGESITSATVAAWHVENGAQVQKGQTLVTLDTDKVSNDLEAEASGTLTIDVSEGTEVEIGSILGTLKSESGMIRPGHDQSSPAQPQTPSTGQAPQPTLQVVEPVPSPTSSPQPSAPTPEPDDSRVTRKKMSPLRRKIAQHLVNAQQTAAILTTFNEVDMTEVMKLRKSVQEDFIKKHGVKLGFMSLFTKAVVQALKDVPAVNGRIDGTDIIENHFYDIGIAIGTEKGLIVPVVRDADQKSFAQIEKDIIAYATKAKEGKIEFTDLQGGVFTISNGGVYGSLLSTPILNPPQSGILGMHTIQQRPVAIDGKVEIRPMMYLALSYDHRLVDGKEAVTFLISIKNSLENPTRMMLEM